MEKLVFRAVIKYFCMKGMYPKEIHEDFVESPSYDTVKKNGQQRLREGERRRESSEDDGRSGRPKNATADENVQVVYA